MPAVRDPRRNAACASWNTNDNALQGKALNEKLQGCQGGGRWRQPATSQDKYLVHAEEGYDSVIDLQRHPTKH